MPRYPYPDVPQLPGVPQLNRSSAFPAGTPPILSGALALGRLVLALLQKAQWGIYKDTTAEDAAEARRVEEINNDDDEDNNEIVVAGSTKPPQPVLIPDSFRTFMFNQEWSVTDAPTEEGGFASYNKVNNPFDVVCRLTKGGSRRDRSEFLEKLDALGNSLQLLRLVTPEREYKSMNLVRYSIRREEQRGAYWFGEIDVYFREIRFVQSQYTQSASSTQNSATAGAAPIVDGGTKQPLDVAVGAVGGAGGSLLGAAIQNVPIPVPPVP